VRGTIVKKPNGRYYVATHGTNPSTGRRQQHSHGGYRTKREAQRALTHVLASIDDGTFVNPSRRVLGDYLMEEWLPAKATRLRPSTMLSYTRTVETHILPELGRLPMQQLTVPMLDGLYRKLLTEGRLSGRGGLSPRSVRYVHTILRQALADAVRKGYLTRNVADFADAPASPRPGAVDVTTWTPDMIRTFLSGIQSDRLYAAYVLAASTGMRRGEVLGVRWEDVDTDDRRLTIRRTLTSVGYQLIEGPPKTKRSARTLPLDASTTAALCAHRALQEKERATWGSAWSDTGHVFTREDGEPVHPDTFAQAFERHVKASGLPRIRFHDLRHSWATNALRAGVPAKIVSDILGHATVAFTLDTYTHAIPEMQTDAVDLVAELVWGGAARS
jgi:integrase